MLVAAAFAAAAWLTPEKEHAEAKGQSPGRLGPAKDAASNGFKCMPAWPAGGRAGVPTGGNSTAGSPQGPANAAGHGARLSASAGAWHHQNYRTTKLTLSCRGDWDRNLRRFPDPGAMQTDPPTRATRRKPWHPAGRLESPPQEAGQGGGWVSQKRTVPGLGDDHAEVVARARRSPARCRGSAAPGPPPFQGGMSRVYRAPRRCSGSASPWPRTVGAGAGAVRRSREWIRVARGSATGRAAPPGEGVGRAFLRPFPGWLQFRRRRPRTTTDQTTLTDTGGDTYAHVGGARWLQGRLPAHDLRGGGVSKTWRYGRRCGCATGVSESAGHCLQRGLVAAC